MKVWSEWLFPRLFDWMAADNEELQGLRGRTLAAARGRVLELGFGTGLNLSHYPPAVHRIVAVDPNPGMADLARERIASAGIEVEHHQITAEALPFDARSFDSVVCTLTLCSIPKVDAALREVHRVLKPGGQFLFFEHGRHPQASIYKWQQRLNPLWRRVFDGCNINRDMAGLVRDSGLQVTALENSVLEQMPKLVGYYYLGRAERRD